MRRWIAAGLVTVGVALGAAGTSSPPFPGAVTALSGLRLLVTLPSAYYGPGDTVAVYCTFRNTGTKSVAVAGDAPLTVLVEEGGRQQNFTQTRPCRPESPSPEAEWAVLPPGGHWTTCVLLKLPRRELTHGDYPLRVYCQLGGKTPSPPGALAPSGVLVSPPVPLVIRYKVLWVG